MGQKQAVTDRCQHHSSQLNRSAMAGPRHLGLAATSSMPSTQGSLSLHTLLNLLYPTWPLPDTLRIQPRPEIGVRSPEEDQPDQEQIPVLTLRNKNKDLNASESHYGEYTQRGRKPWVVDARTLCLWPQTKQAQTTPSKRTETKAMVSSICLQHPKSTPTHTCAPPGPHAESSKVLCLFLELIYLYVFILSA